MTERPITREGITTTPYISRGIPAPIMLDCGHVSTPTDISPGYGNSEGKRICFACCADQDKHNMDHTGKAVLYLVPDGEAWAIKNWPGSLKFRAYNVCQSKHGGGFGSRRIDARFRDHNGNEWQAICRGDMDLARCRRLTPKPAPSCTSRKKALDSR